MAIASVQLKNSILSEELLQRPIVNGGILATQIMTEGALAKGATMAAALGAVIFAIQKFVGTIPASICGRKEAKALSDEFRSSLAKGINLWEVEAEGTTVDYGKPAKVPFWKKHEKYYTAYVTLGIGAIVGGLCAQTLAKITGLNYAIWGIVLGVICNQLGIVPPNLMDKGKSSGVWMMACFCSIIPSLGNVSLSDLATLLWSTTPPRAMWRCWWLPSWCSMSCPAGNLWGQKTWPSVWLWPSCWAFPPPCSSLMKWPLPLPRLRMKRTILSRS